MKQKATYQAARQVSETIRNHFQQHLEKAQSTSEAALAPAPSASCIEIMLDTAFWSSLRREEGRSPKISLAYLPPQMAVQPLLFEQALPLSSYLLNKLSPGVDRPGIHLGVWEKEDKLWVWGTTQNIPPLCFVLDVSEPGLLVIKHRRNDGIGKFANVAILVGDQVKIIDEQITHMPDCPSLLSSMLGTQATTFWSDSLNVLVQLAVSMRAHARGGILLVVPQNSTTWRQSIIHSLPFAISPLFSGLSELMAQPLENRNTPKWQGKLRREIDHIGGLTAIDGATLISDAYHLLAFGAKISRQNGKEPVEEILLTEPIVGVQPYRTHPGKTGGTRHLSAAQFVFDQRDSLALVASQDGRFTIFSWSACEQIVQAHRIETLLL